jgi:hypothetical protein
MRESNLRDQFREIVTKFPGHVTNHEDKFVKGVFDASFSFRVPNQYSCTGWVEFKHHDELPKRRDTLIKVGFKKEQYLWGEERDKHGDNMSAIIRVVDSIYFIKTPYFRELHHGVTLARLEQIWIGKWHKRMNPSELRDLLMGVE